MPLLRMQNISKSFPGVKALDNVSIEVNKGEILAIVGENGAGKSTLMKILAGVYANDEGEIFFEDKKINIRKPNQALDLGIRTVYQELSVFATSNVAHNFYADKMPKGRFGLLDYKRLYKDARKILDEFGFTDISEKTPIRHLSIGRQQLIEILRAYTKDVKLLILDEPTSALTEKETQLLFKIVRMLKEKGVSVIYISHRLEEIFEVCDKAVVLRDGQFVAQLDVKKSTKDDIVKLMVGRDVVYDYGAGTSEIKNIIFEAKDIRYKNVVKNASLTLHSGEILGLGGLEGSGRTELVECLFGARKRDSGAILIDGKEIKSINPCIAGKMGIAYITKDRKKVGLFMRQSVAENILSGNIKKFSNGIMLDFKELNKKSREYVEKFEIKTPTIKRMVYALSGGNQQKVLLAMWLTKNPRILIVDEPTRGIDVGTKEEIHALLRDLAKQGVGIIMISSDMPELLAASDRIIVMYEGTIRGELMHTEADEHKVIRFASGNAK